MLVLAGDIATWAIETIKVIVVRKNIRVVTPYCRANGMMWISLGANVIARSSEFPSSVIVRKNLTM